MGDNGEILVSFHFRQRPKSLLSNHFDIPQYWSHSTNEKQHISQFEKKYEGHFLSS